MEDKRIEASQEGDLISRQAALDALNKHSVMFEFHLPHEFYEVKKEIRALPSAQPRWIPVTERLPLEYTRVIGYMAWKAMTAIEYQHGRWYSIDHLEPLPDEAVSHWMPLPQPPKEGDE